MADKPKRDHRFFEQWARRNGMAPVERLTDVTVGGEPVSDILIADSGVPLWRSEYPPLTIDHDMIVFYRTGYCFHRPGEKAWIAVYADYPIDSFSQYAGDSRQKARVDDCKHNAAQTLAQVKRVGLFDGNNRRITH